MIKYWLRHTLNVFWVTKTSGDYTFFYEGIATVEIDENLYNFINNLRS